MDKTTNNTQYFIHNTLSLLAALLATGKCQVVKALEYTPGKWEYYLTPAEVCQQLQTDYLNDRLMVSASKIAEKVQLLKSMQRRNY